MIYHVLVALDGSARSEAILPFVLRLTAPLRPEVTLLTVVHPVTPAESEEARITVRREEEARAARARRYLGGLAAALVDSGATVRTLIRWGDPVPEILAAVAETRADLLALTTHGWTALRELAMGSVAAAVIRQLTLPALLVRSGDVSPDADRQRWAGAWAVPASDAG